MNAGVGNIPWSDAERSGEMTRFMALTRGEGSFFYTVSPEAGPRAQHRDHSMAGALHRVAWPSDHIQALRAQGGWRAGDAQQGLQAWARADDGPLHRLPALEQRLRRSSVAAALRAASAPSQQHQLRRGRDAQNERDGAGLSSDSVAAALRAP